MHGSAYLLVVPSTLPHSHTRNTHVLISPHTGADILIMARTDARAGLGMDEAIYRCQRFRELGADITFLEAPESVEEMQRYCREVRFFRLWLVGAVVLWVGGSICLWVFSWVDVVALLGEAVFRSSFFPIRRLSTKPNRPPLPPRWAAPSWPICFRTARRPCSRPSSCRRSGTPSWPTRWHCSGRRIMVDDVDDRRQVLGLSFDRSKRCAATRPLTHTFINTARASRPCTRR